MIPTLPPPLQPQTPIGSSLIRELINAVRDVVSRGYSAGPGIHIDDKTITSVGGDNSITIQRVRVWAKFNDYIICRAWDGATAGTVNILVAKPYKLRHILANYDSLATLITVSESRVTVTGAPSASPETWSVTPAYDAYDDLFIMSGHAGGTGVEVAGEELAWLDLNVDARAWAEDRT